MLIVWFHLILTFFVCVCIPVALWIINCRLLLCACVRACVAIATLIHCVHIDCVDWLKHVADVCVLCVDRHWCHRYFTDPWAVDADIRCAQGAAQISLTHVRPHHGRHQSAGRSQETLPRCKYSCCNTGTIARSYAGLLLNFIHFWCQLLVHHGGIGET